jgi:hypothetical protein
VDVNQIDVLNNKLLSSVNDTYPIGLVNGKLGLCIYYYYLSHWEKKEEFKQVAEKWLDDIVSQLSDTMDVTVEAGLAGVAIGISHLVKEKFVGGDINEILEEVDSTIFKKLAFLEYKDTKHQIPKEEFIQLLYYLYLRHTEQTSSDDKYIFQELIIRTIEMFKHNLQTGFFNEHFSFSIRNFQLPFFLYIISKIYDLNIYNDRITKMLEEYVNQIVSTIPVLHANRLYLLWGLVNIKTCLPGYKKEIESHIQLLKESIDIDRIVNTELMNQDIYIMDGLSFVYMLLFCMQMNYPAYSIDYNPQLFFDKISNSDAWDTLLNRKFYFYKCSGLFDGFPGANLILLHIKKHFS